MLIRPPDIIRVSLAEDAANQEKIIKNSLLPGKIMLAMSDSHNSEVLE